MTNYNERLDEILSGCEKGILELYLGGVISKPKTEARQAITSLYKELVAEAMPEPGTNLTSYEAQMFIISTEEYRQNLLKALEEV